MKASSSPIEAQGGGEMCEKAPQEQKQASFPKDGENIRSSELPEDLAQEKRRKKEGSGLLKRIAVAHGGVRCPENRMQWTRCRGSLLANSKDLA